MPNIIDVKEGQSLQKALKSAREGDILRLGEGTWREKVEITAPNLTLIGAGAGRSRIGYDDYAKKLHPDGRELNTFRTYPLAVLSDGVRMYDLSVINDYQLE